MKSITRLNICLTVSHAEFALILRPALNSKYDTQFGCVEGIEGSGGENNLKSLKVFEYGYRYGHTTRGIGLIYSSDLDSHGTKAHSN